MKYSRTRKYLNLKTMKKERKRVIRKREREREKKNEERERKKGEKDE